MSKGVRCSSCGNVVKEVCADCWRCSACCDCRNKTGRVIDGHIGRPDEKSKKIK